MGPWQQKLNRAKEHYEALKRSMLAEFGTDLCTFSRQQDPEGRTYLVRIHFQRQLPLDQWCLVAGDCIHNLRCVLDHLVYGIAVRVGGKDPPDAARKLMFPIVDKPANFTPKRWGLDTLPQDIRDEIESLQPYNRSDAKTPTALLSILRYLNDTDKHRLVILAAMRPFRVEYKWITPLPAGTEIGMYAARGSLTDGDVFSGFTLNPPYPGVQYDFEPAILVGIEHLCWVEGTKFSELEVTLRVLLGEVEFVDRLERFA